MPAMKLMYFNGRGLAETTRILLAAANKEYEDFRYPMTFGTPGDFSTLKRDEWQAARDSGELDSTMGMLPCIEIDGVRIGQSKAVERFAAKACGFMGANEVEAGLIDMLTCSIQDSKDAYNKVKGIKDEGEKKAAMDKYFAEDLPAFMAKFEKSIPKGPGPFLMGNSPSLADISWFNYLAAPKCFCDNAEGAQAAYQGCPRVKAAIDTVAAMPGVQAWLTKRPDTPF